MMSNVHDHQSPSEVRRISGPLMLGLLTMPLLFGWFLARRGYANSTREVVAVYALIPLAASIMNALA
ncbi:hypothetical protein [Sphingomonas sanguinis]|uniref:hypothetical protein n=1 Tax=Sphingomonas sanguinis TaxID=33051 RepID=UPI00187C2E78|nr:hypothetical protein [Sphingomonas sanguinis]